MTSDFALYVVETKEEADRLNAILPKRIRSVYRGQLLCGTNYKGARPNVLIVGYTEDTPEYERWFNVCIRSGMRIGYTTLTITE